MKILAIVLALVMCLGIGAASAAERSPAALMPAEVGVYVDVNLKGFTGVTPDAQALQNAFGLVNLVSTAREALAKDPKAQAALDAGITTALELGKALGWRIGFGLAVDTAALMGGGEPSLYLIANMADPNAFQQALQTITQQFGQGLTPGEPVGNVSVYEIPAANARLAQGSDWVAFVLSKNDLDTVIGFASGEKPNSLAADPGFQSALARLPQDAFVTEYVSGPLMKQVIEMLGATMPNVTLPTPPEGGMAFAAALRVAEVGGKQVIQTTSQMDLDAAAFFVRLPITMLASEMFGSFGEEGAKTQCLANVKNLSLAMNMYATDWDKFPKADKWVTELEDYVKNDAVFHCPNDPSGAKSSYGMNWGLSGKLVKSLTTDWAKKVVIYETKNPGDCPRGNKYDVADPPRHMGGNNYGFVDGHAKWFPEPTLDSGEVEW